MHCRIFNSIPGLYLLDSSNSFTHVVATKNVLRLCPNSYWEGKSAPWLRATGLISGMAAILLRSPGDSNVYWGLRTHVLIINYVLEVPEKEWRTHSHFLTALASEYHISLTLPWHGQRLVTCMPFHLSTPPHRGGRVLGNTAPDWAATS